MGKQFNYSQARTVNKKDVNSEYIEIIKDLDCKDGNHLILDSRFKNTTKTLNSIKIPIHNIYIPNPYEKVDAPNWSDQFVGDFLNSWTGGAFRTVYLDYCCTLEGNVETRPRFDIQKLMEKRLVNGVLGIELNRRDPRKSGGVRSWGDICDLINYVENLAFDNGYTYQVIDGWTYGQMFTVWFHLVRR
jgi:hypothetical protein